MSLTMTLSAAGAALLLIYVVLVYNRLVYLRNGVENAMASVDVQLKQRCDLVPKLVDAMSAYMGHERETFDELTRLREQATTATATADRMALDDRMSGLLRGLVARAEAYPELKASDTVTLLQRSLNEVESQIAAARRSVNASVMVFNTRIEVFPNNLMAGLLGFQRRALFEASAEERAVPSVRR